MSSSVVTLIHQVSRIVHGAGHAGRLYPAQWAALRYFAQAEDPARTVTALARFQDLTIPPVARTVRALVDKGLLARQPNPRRKRSDVIDVTPVGRALLCQDPHLPLQRVVDSLDSRTSKVLGEALEIIATALPHAMAAARGESRHANQDTPPRHERVRTGRHAEAARRPQDGA